MPVRQGRCRGRGREKRLGGERRGKLGERERMRERDECMRVSNSVREHARARARSSRLLGQISRAKREKEIKS